MRFLSVATLIFALGLSATARADVIATRRVIAEGEKISRVPETRILASDNAYLSEYWFTSSSEKTPYYLQRVSLNQRELNRSVTMDRTLKIFTVDLPFMAADYVAPIVRLTFLGEEEILGFKTRRFRIERIYAKTERTPFKMTLAQEVWILPANQIPGLPKGIIGFDKREKITGDTQFLSELKNGFMVRHVDFALAYDEEKPKVRETEELSSLTICELDPALFQIPADYREVSAVQFTELVTKNAKNIAAKNGVKEPIPTKNEGD